eukprot:gnl/Hemi2/16392_TR5465_c0_g1_i1.p1 gnl/Hemi2/16392_TR5465_c0_g1~~gnl/Hemi2/16392_TR5465_c0_g1_i1.p1  ORF type:complete len:381 (-),score=4.60 gnl/Hemi2/16392_TR5465_c0_g1_i1:85-1227(-)
MSRGVQPPQDDSHVILRDRHGFVVEGGEEVCGQYLRYAVQYEPLLARRKLRWDSMFKTVSPLTADKSSALKDEVRKGIPSEYRREVWLNVSGAYKRMCANRGYYQSLLDRHILDVNKNTDQIDVDLHRTFPGHTRFRTPEGLLSLRRVLVAFSFHNTSIGYCQSMNVLCGVLLVLMSEEEAFWTLAQLVEEILPPQYFTEFVEGCIVDQKVLRELTKEKFPRILLHLDVIQFDFSLLANWLMCVYAQSFPAETFLRIWDVVFYEGSKVLFRIALAQTRMNKKAILVTRDLGDMMDLIRGWGPRAIDCEALLKYAFTNIGSLPGAHISKLRKQCWKVVQQEMEEFHRRRAATGSISGTPRTNGHHWPTDTSLSEDIVSGPV